MRIGAFYLIKILQIIAPTPFARSSTPVSPPPPPLSLPTLSFSISLDALIKTGSKLIACFFSTIVLTRGGSPSRKFWRLIKLHPLTFHPNFTSFFIFFFPFFSLSMFKIPGLDRKRKKISSLLHFFVIARSLERNESRWETLSLRVILRVVLMLRVVLSFVRLNLDRERIYIEIKNVRNMK